MQTCVYRWHVFDCYIGDTHTHTFTHFSAVGFEIAHIDDASERAWLTQRIGQLFGGNGSSALSPAERVNAATLMLQVFQEWQSMEMVSCGGHKLCV